MTGRPARQLARRFAGLAVAAGLALAACKKREEPAPAPAPTAFPAAELKRGQDACRAYVAQVCECAKTVPAAQQPCARAQALPDSLDLAVQVSAHPETERKDGLQSAAEARKLIAGCIEQTAKLPELGCAAPAPRR